mmetsp:Transcript_47750/g.153739  ORF Transcript_47750/g.153739 Transcript_47750/m.153739 type:complete len:1058 (+) Transcript_47750:105-3278(+)
MEGMSVNESQDVVFSVFAETDGPGVEVRIVGSADVLGRWHPEGGVALRTEAGKYPRWSTAVRFPTGCSSVDYKFIKVRQDNTVEWEQCPDRQLAAGIAGPAEPSTPRFGQRSFTTSVSAATAVELPVPAPQLAPVPQLAPPPPLPPPPPARLPQLAALPSLPPSSPPCVEEPSSMPLSTPSRPQRLPVGASRGSSTCVLPVSREGAATTSEVSFETTCRMTMPGDVIRVVGSADALGSWDPKLGLPLATSAETFPQWSASTRLPLGVPMEWKLVISRAQGALDWERGENRRATLSPESDDGMWRIRVDFNGPAAEPEPCKRSKFPSNSPQSGAASSGSTSPCAPASAGSAGSGATGVAASESGAISSAPSSAAVSLTPSIRHEDHLETSRRRLSASLSLIPDTEPQVSGDYAPIGRTASERKLDAAVPDHKLVFRLSNLCADVAAMLVVEVSFEGSTSRKQLQLEKADDNEARWTVGVLELGLPPGLHLFRFLVEGEHALSCEHPVYTESNAILFNEPLRRYILVREMFVQNLVPGLFSSRSTSKSSGPKDDHDDGGPQKSTIVRPWSCSHSLASMAKDSPQRNVPKFANEVFEGLYDTELSLRLDNVVLPETTPSTSSSSRSGSGLRLWSGAHMLKKAQGACEDAYFAGEDALGVADGVGCMVQFASYGVNAAAYATELMLHACQALRVGGGSAEEELPPVEERAVAAMVAAEENADAYGASTITVLVLQGRQIGVANLGDSGFMLLRKTPRGMSVVASSPEQQHSWNCPYQLTRLPPKLLSRFQKTLTLDRAVDCERFCADVRPGDLLLLFTDGMRDNLHEQEVLHIVDCVLAPALGELVGLPEHATPPQLIARSLALAAQERSLDPIARVPFVEYSKRYGYQCLGGKQDDITVVAAWVMPEDVCEGSRPAPPVPAAAAAAAAARAAAAAVSVATPAAEPAATAATAAAGARAPTAEGGDVKVGTAGEMTRRPSGSFSARLHKGPRRDSQAKSSQVKYETSHATADATAGTGKTSSSSAAGGKASRREFRPVSGSKARGASKTRPGSRGAKRMET